MPLSPGLASAYTLTGKHGAAPLENQTFASSAEFLRWAQRIVKYKYQGYERVPVGKQMWTYGDGHVLETELGKRGGTMLANLAYMTKTGSGGLKHSRDAQTVADIDSRGGVVLTLDWGE